MGNYSYLLSPQKEDNNVIYTVVIGNMYCENCVNELVDLFPKKTPLQQGCIASNSPISDSLTYYKLHEKRPAIETVILPKSYHSLVDSVIFWPVLIETNLQQKDTTIYAYSEIFTSGGLIQKSFRKKLKNKLKR